VKLKLRYLFLALIVIFGAWTPAAADDSTVTADAIMAFLTEPAPSQRDPLLQIERNSAAVHLMGEVVEAVVNVDFERLDTALKNIEAIDGNRDDVWQNTVEFARDVLAASREDADPDSPTGSALLDYLERYDASDDWYINSIVQSLAAYTYITRNQSLIAARHVRDAMELIPTELSEYATDARLRSSEVSMVLHGMQGNPDFLLEAARLQRNIKAEIGEPFNRYELMTNFVYTLNRVRDFEGAAKVAELLVQEDRPADSLPGLAEGYMAETFNELQDYDRARQLSERSLSLSEHAVVGKRAKYMLVVALAGLGLEDEAHAIMDEQGWDHDHDALLTQINAQAVLHAEALLAMHRSDPKFALSLMKRRTDILVQRVQRSNSSDMTSLLSNLENTRERQSEREGALQREAELKAVQLEQKTNLNRLLWALIAVLTIAFNLLLAFLRYRERLSGKVQGLQKDALSAEKMKTEFLGVINHELRTPLNGIIGISDAMIHHAKDPMMQAQASAVQESGQLLFDLLDSLITMSTIEGNRLTLETEAADLSKTIAREAQDWAAQAEKKGLAFTTFIAPELSETVIADEKHLRQCVRFLLSNAVRFTHEGRIHLHATAEPDAEGDLAVKIIVADTGQGMSEDVQSRLFKPFLQADAMMTRKYGGAGLSLAIGRKLARMMDGDLDVTSRAGAGSEFVLTVKLPIANPVSASKPVQSDLAEIRHVKAKKTSAVPPQSSGSIPTLLLHDVVEPEDIIDLMLEEQLFSSPTVSETSLTVLLGDDGGSQTQDLRSSLKDLGCHCVQAETSPQLLKRLEDRQIDVVMLNVQLPGLDAVDAIVQIRQRSDQGYPILIVGLVADESPAIKAKLFSAGADLLLDLPLKPNRLADALQQARSLRTAA